MAEQPPRASTAAHENEDEPKALGAWRYCWQYVKNCFSADLRSVATLRMALGLLLLVDLGDRAIDLQAHYSDDGVLPIWALMSTFKESWRISLHAANGTTVFQAMIFLLHAGCAFLLMIGWRSRLMCLLCWVLMVSLHNRNPWILQGHDVLFRLLFLWACFLPLGAKWSIDAMKKPHGIEKGGSNTSSILTAGTIIILLQMVIMYLSTAGQKNHPTWWSGRALQQAMEMDHYVSSWGIYLKQFPELMRWLTWMTLLIEWIAPLAVLLTRGWWRLVPLGLLLGMHIGFDLFMHLGLFSYVSMAGWIVAIPAVTWNRLEPRIHRAVQGLQIARRAKFLLKIASIDRARTRIRPSHQAIAVGLALAAWGWHARYLWPDTIKPWYPSPLVQLANITRISQTWAMFAPEPSRTDGWFIVSAKYVSGDTKDLLTDHLLSYEKPQDQALHYGGQRWRTFFRGLMGRKNREKRSRLLLRHYLRTHETDNMESLSIYFMREITNKDDLVSGEPVRLKIADRTIIDQAEESP